MQLLPHPATAQRNALAATLEIAMRRAERADAEAEVRRLLAERAAQAEPEIPAQRTAQQ